MKNLFSLTDKANDLFRRSLSLRSNTPETVNISVADTARLELADDASGDTFTYGEIDQRGQQPGEQCVTVPQGNGEVAIYYNPSSREARPIPVNLK